MPSKHTAPTRQVVAAAAVANAPSTGRSVRRESGAGKSADGNLFWQVINIRHLSADENSASTTFTCAP